MRSQTLRSLSKTNSLEGCLAFGELVFGYRPASHHIEMVRVIFEALYRREDTLILEPAGAAKTTWGNTIFLTWLISMFRNVRVGLFSQTSTFAENFSRAIMHTLESNEEHRALFGDLVDGGRWTLAEWIRKGSLVAESKDLTLFAGGTGGQVASKRFDILLLDDILGEENTATTDQREKVQTWFDKSLYPRMVANGVCIAFGTRWAPDDLYQTLMTPVDEGGYGFRTIVRRALIEDESEPLGFRSYWPEMWSVEDLLKRRSRNRATFDCSYQNDVGGLLEGDIFRKPWFQWYGTPGGDPDEELPRGRRWTKRMGVDLATSLKERADSTARCTTAEDTEGNFYVMRADKTKIGVGHGDYIVAGYNQTPGIGLVKIESVQFQSTVVAEIMRDYPQVPVSAHKTDNDKRTRAQAVAAKYEARKVWHHASLRDGDLEREQLAFKGRPGDHDDLIDAEGFSMELGGGSFFFGRLDMSRRAAAARAI